MFQFHKGTIKTSELTLAGVGDGGFNSIKVRLRLNVVVLHPLLLLHFNSIKVRLRRTKEELSNFFSIFQFHKGTIKTVVTLDEDVAKLISIP